MSSIIKKYNFIDSNEVEILTEKDFIINSNEPQEIGILSKGIVSSFKKSNNPSVVLFFYDDTESSVLTEWREAKTKEESVLPAAGPFIPGTLTNKVTYYQVNLDFSKDILNMFARNIFFDNPFFWTKVDFANSKNPFAYFYINGYPQFSYEGAVNGALIFDFFHNWSSKIDNTDLFRLKSGDTSIVNSKFAEGYYTVINDHIFNSSGTENVEILAKNTTPSVLTGITSIELKKDEVYSYTKEIKSNNTLTIVLTPLYEKNVNNSLGESKEVESIKLDNFEQKNIIPYLKRIEKNEKSLSKIVLKEGVLTNNFWL